MQAEKTSLNMLFAVKHALEGMFNGEYPPSPETVGYNKAISDAVQMILAKINAELDAQIVK